MRLFFVRAASAFAAQPIWIFIVGIASILALTGPFGTYERLTLWERFAYWGPLALGAQLCVRLSVQSVDHMLPDLSPLARQLSMIVIFPLIYAPALWCYSLLFVRRFEDPPGLLMIWAQIFAVTAAVGLLTYFMIRSSVPVDGERPVRLYQRLPEDSRGKVARLSVSDHYVEVYLDDGTCHRLLMRFADAVAEMDGAPGFCTHRSHWVAADQVVAAFREKQREFLRLRDGAAVPVSRTYRETVQAAGFL